MVALFTCFYFNMELVIKIVSFYVQLEFVFEIDV